MTLSVVVPTYCRPTCVDRNLRALGTQEVPADQVVVVDASADDETLTVVDSLRPTLPFAVVYRRNAGGRGNTPSSRNMALLDVTGDIVAFLDDDAFVRPGWAAALMRTYADPSIGGVGGRALNGVSGEDVLVTDVIGRLRPDGTMVGNFASDPGSIVDVDHMIGCNMSVRRTVLAHLGGFKDDFRAGPFGICEETELCIRARRLGYRLVFEPSACVDHVGAPQPGSRRFSPTYSYYHAKNNLVMVIRNYGLGGMAIRHIGAVGVASAHDSLRKVAGAIARLLCGIVGLAAGLSVGAWYAVTTGRNAVRDCAGGREISGRLRRDGYVAQTSAACP